jgi:glutamate-1-semialdehyde 2,1-aminomutase
VTSIQDRYTAAHPGSQARFQEQAKYTPSGITHHSRGFEPFPLFIDRCSGARKWDCDGQEYVDYWMGHGANLLGHGHPEVLEAASHQLGRGLHAGGETELGLEWARAVCNLVPCAEQVRFTASGGEATQLAIRLARALTGKDKIIKFQFHYHGWHDAVMTSVDPPFDVPMSPGIPRAVQQDVISVPCNDIGLLVSAFDRSDAIAAVILEPSGGHYGSIPIDPEFLRELRRQTAERGILLIFDEVVTGFRYAPGGAQEFFGVTPDLATFGKIMGGGFPVGALAGSRAHMEPLGHKHDPDWMRYKLIPQHGTWNANPMVAAAGIAALRLVATGEPTAAAAELATQLREDLNSLFARHGIAATAYGTASIWKTYLGPPAKMLSGDFSAAQEECARVNAGWGTAKYALRQAVLLGGVDIMHNGGFMSVAHTREDLDRTVDAFDGAIRDLKAEGLV